MLINKNNTTFPPLPKTTKMTLKYHGGLIDGRLQNRDLMIIVGIVLIIIILVLVIYKVLMYKKMEKEIEFDVA
jgi:hypothetical protein